jgi:hypothetical protein
MAKIIYVIECKCLSLKDQGLVWVLLYSLLMAPLGSMQAPAA